MEEVSRRDVAGGEGEVCGEALKGGNVFCLGHEESFTLHTAFFGLKEGMSCDFRIGILEQKCSMFLAWLSFERYRFLNFGFG